MTARDNKRGGPWWVAAFAFAGRGYVMRFKAGADCVVDPLSVQILNPDQWITPRFHQAALNAARRYAVEHNGIIRDAWRLAAGEPGLGAYRIEAAE